MRWALVIGGDATPFRPPPWRLGTFRLAAKGISSLVEQVGWAQSEVVEPLSCMELDGTLQRTRLQFPGMRRSMPSLVAISADGAVAGEIRWSTRGGETALVWVPEHLQRRGIATALLAEAVRRQPDVHHSSQLTSDARA